MNINDMVKKTGEWLKGTGPAHDIVLSSRIRLARNLAPYPFPEYMTDDVAETVITQTHQAIDGSNYLKKHLFFPYTEISALDRELLLERHLISRDLAGSERPCGVCFTEDEIVSIMINEEDHLRIQVLQSGFNLLEALRIIDIIDTELERELPYAFNNQLGYLTACPTNVGTGLRASCMLHLPALVMTKQINKVLQALARLNIAVRGLYGEGTQAVGNLFQFSNQVTLGKNEETIATELEKIVKQVIDHEREARESLLKKRSDRLIDQIWRSVGVLKSARIVSSEEASSLLSLVRLGSDLGIAKNSDIHQMNELFMVIQPAHLQKIFKKELPVNERDIKRAALIREKLQVVPLE